MKFRHSLLSFLMGMFLMYIAGTNAVLCQSISFQGLYSESSYSKYLKSAGYSFAYERETPKGNSMIFSVSHEMYGSPYEYQYSPTGNPSDLWYQEINPFNHRLKLGTDLGFRIINLSRFSLYFGPTFSFNFFFLNEEVKTSHESLESPRHNVDNEVFPGKFGFGMFMRLKVSSLKFQNYSFIFDVTPELSVFNHMFARGSYYPGAVGWLNFKAGISYSLKEK